MKVEVSFSELSSFVNLAKNIATEKSSILIDCDGGYMAIIEGGYGIKKFMEMLIIEKGHLFVKFADIDKLIKVVKKADRVIIELRDEHAQVTVNDLSFIFETGDGDVEQYRNIEFYDGDYSFQVNGTDLKEALSKVFFIVKRSSKRKGAYAYEKVIRFEIEAGLLTLIGTDGHRLACYSLEVELSDILNFELPITAISWLLKHLNKEGIHIRYSRSRGVVFEWDGVIFSTKTEDVNYPDYRAVFPRDFAFVFTVDRSDLLNALRRLDIGFDKKEVYKPIIFTFEGNEVNLFNEKTSTLIRLPIQIIDQKDGIEKIGFNLEYLVDVLDKAFIGPQVTFKVVNSFSPVLMRDDYLFYTYILMPMKVE